jgi:hypothetical protein
VHALVRAAEREARSLRDRAATAIEAGRIDEAEWFIKRLSDVDPHCVATQNLRRAVQQCRAAWALVNEGKPGHAAEMLQRAIEGGPAHRFVAAPNELQEFVGVEMTLAPEHGLQDHPALRSEAQVTVLEVVPESVDWTAFALGFARPVKGGRHVIRLSTG